MWLLYSLLVLFVMSRFAYTTVMFKNINLDLSDIKRQDDETNIDHHPELEAIEKIDCRAQDVVDVSNTSTHRCKIIGVCAECPNLGLTAVPNNLPADIIKLNLSFNQLELIPDFAFDRYRKLEYIFVNSNRLTRLYPSAFVNLTVLQVLDLFNNSLEMTGTTFPDEVFSSLISVVSLRISRNNRELNKTELAYPDVALSRMIALQTLYLDGLEIKKSPTAFGRGFRNLTKLHTLMLSGGNPNFGFCNLRSLYNNTFENLGQVGILRLQNCGLFGERIEADAFKPLINLQILNLIFNENINADSLGNVFYGLRNSRELERLYINRIVNRYSLSICFESSWLKYMPKSITYLEARENQLEGMDRNTIRMLPPNIEYLDLSGNLFRFGTYFQDLHVMKNLQRLFINGINTNYVIPYSYPAVGHDVIRNASCHLYKETNGLGGKNFILKLPPRLERIQMNNAGLMYRLTELHVDPNNSLNSLSLRFNNFPSLEGPITGLNELKFLDLSYCYIKKILPQFFQNFSSLQYLYLQGNALGDFFYGNRNIKSFFYLNNLKVLNMSYCNIYDLRPAVFSEQRNLTKLSLEHNPLDKFDVNITHMWSLTLLNLSSTHVTTLSPATRRHVDQLRDNNVNTTLNLAETPIACTCENLNFLIWISKSQAFTGGFKGYICVFPDFSNANLATSFQDILKTLTRKCTSNAVLFFIVGSCTAVMIGVIIGLLLYRFRYNLKYLYYAAYTRYQNKNHDDVAKFQYDAFICYAEEDVGFVNNFLKNELVARGLKLFIHSEDFTAGEYISSNIVRAVCACRKTVVLLTRDLVASTWCMFEIEMAKMEAVYSGRQVLLFVIMEKLPKGQIGRDLLYNVKNNTYLEFPGDQSEAEVMVRWWDKLASDIMH